MAFSLFPLKNFPNEPTAAIFSLIFIIILISELRILIRYKSKKEDKNSFYIVLLGIFLPLIITIALSYTNKGNINTSISYIGILILLSGFYLRQISIKKLGKLFTPAISKQKSQKIIRDGPYKYIRHPSYTALLLELTGTTLALSNLISFVIAIIFFIPSISYRIKIEEEFLNKHFKEYADYQKNTKKLIPFIY